MEALQGYVNGKLYIALTPVVQKLDSAIHQINHYPPDKYQGNQCCVIKWIEIYLAPVAQKLDSTIHRVNHYRADKY